MSSEHSPSPIDLKSIHLGNPSNNSSFSSIGSHSSMTQSSMYKSPMKTKHNSHLRIDVPETLSSSQSPANNSEEESDNEFHEFRGNLRTQFASASPCLGAPIEFSENSPSTIFDNITHLPTPVISHGSFQSTYSNVPLDIAKSRSSPKHYNDSMLPSPPRVISDYKPVSVLGRKNSLLENKPSKRFVSNPVGLFPPPSNHNSGSLISPVSSTTKEFKNTLKSKVSEDIENTQSSSKYLNKTFYSSKLLKTFKFVEEIGHGNFSTVVLAKDSNNSDDLGIAIKIISVPIDDINEISNFKSYIKRELSILHQIHHPCVIEVLDYSINLAISREEIESPGLFDDIDPSQDNQIVNSVDYLNLQENSDQLIMVNYCPGGNLLQFLSKFNNSLVNTKLYYWKVLKRVVSELIVTVAHLHSMDIVHRDIKLENILLNYSLDKLAQLSETQKALINLTDFGLSKKLRDPQELLSTRCGSQDYIPPELLMGLKYDGKLSDSWSVGVVIYSILEDRLPFDLPPLSMLEAAGVSPSVIKRKTSKQSSAHRIAMIDWDWYKINGLLQSTLVDEEIKAIITDLKEVVDVLLVRKNKRLSVSEILEQSRFSWIRNQVPSSFVKPLARC
jgi:protein-serine/threonine kinase